MTADQKYQETMAQVKKEIEILGQKLEALDIDQKESPKNWGNAASASHILNKLNELNYEFLDEY